MFGDVEEIDALEWKEMVLASKRLVVVEFWNQQCPHCRAIEPVYDELALEYGDKLKFTRLDVFGSHENQQLAAQHGIMGTPTFLFFCGGRPINGVVGALPKEDLAQAIEFTTRKYNDCTKKSSPLKLSYIS
jgi:thioredoxin 1